MRQVLRTQFGTPLVTETFAEPDWRLEQFPTNAPQFRAAAAAVLETFAARLRAYERTELLLGFPAAPFILPLAVADPDRFLAFADLRPVHNVRLRRSGSSEAPERIVTLRDEPLAYWLTFQPPRRGRVVDHRERGPVGQTHPSSQGGFLGGDHHLPKVSRWDAYLSAPLRAG